MQIEDNNDLYFCITHYRKMFARIVKIFILILICYGYLLYQLFNVKQPVYYASSESGVLKVITPYEKQEVIKIIAG